MDPKEKAARESGEQSSFAAAGGNAAPDQARGGGHEREDGHAENEAEFTDIAHEAPDGSGKAVKPQQEPGEQQEAAEQQETARRQEKARNAENARRRREADEKARLEKTRREAIIEALGGKNPYTGEQMRDAEDVSEFLRMQRIEKEGGDPVADYARTVKEETRARTEEARRSAEQEQWYQDDREAFLRKHPGVDLNALVENSQFSSFADGKVGRMPLSEIYEGFLALTGEYERRAEERAAQLLANKNASPGSLTGAEAGAAGFLTREQVKGMSKDEVHRSYDRILESMKHWR